MPSFASISPEKLARLLGTPDCPRLIDVRSEEEIATDPRLVPGSQRLSVEEVAQVAVGARVVICETGGASSHGSAALLRSNGVPAEALEGGFEAWKSAGLPLLKATSLPPRDALGRTVWVTRARPKVDRIACPWLIRRFVDPEAVFLFVPPGEVVEVAERFSGAPFDVEGVFWTHRGDECTFDLMVREFELQSPPLLRLAEIVRGADTDRLDLMPQAAGLLAASLGLSRMYSDDLQQLDAAMVVYDAFYRWARDAASESHTWVHHQGKGSRTS